jgi:hypothetical protein
VRIEIARPSNVTTFVDGPVTDANAILDGMARDDADTLYVTANVAGEVWKVTQDRRICALARGLKFPSMAAFGGGTSTRGFSSRNLYVVGFGGELTELRDVTSSPPPSPPLQPLQVALSRKRAPLRKNVKVKATVSVLGVPGIRPAKGATVRLAGKRATTDARGRATVTVKFTKMGVRRASASLTGFRPATAPISAGP